MREIIFRGKRKDNGEWITGYYSAELYSNTHYISSWFYGSYAELQKFEVIPETVGQFAGLLDANEKRIFTGDIIKTHYANAVKADFVEQVVFNNGKYCGMCKLEGGGRMFAPLADGVPHVSNDKSIFMDRVEVIGNVHDNPELLNTNEERDATE